MTWLFIDTHVSGTSRLGTFHTDGSLRVRMYKGRTRTLLVRIHRLWKEGGSAWRGIAVVSGPGSFSSIRTGVLYANILANCLRIPLLGLTTEEAMDDRWIEKRLSEKGSLSKMNYVAPVYDAEPNITLPQSV